MKIWKSLLILIFLILFAASGYWVYHTYFSSRKLNNLEVVSNNAVFVFETAQLGTTWKTLTEDPSWEILKTFPGFQKLSSQLKALDSLSGGGSQILEKLAGRQTSISLHPTGIESFELLFTVNLSEDETLGLIEELKSQIPTGSQFQTRTYSDKAVFEYFNTDNTQDWSITHVGDLAIISESSFLVEEAIRFYVNGNTGSFFDLNKAEPLNNSGLGRLLLSGKSIGSLLKGVRKERESAIIESFDILNGVVALDLNLKENELEFSGPVFYGDQVNFTPSIAANLGSIQNLIPNQTRSITQINLESIFETQKISNRAFSGRSTLSGEIQRKLIDRGFFDSFTGELYFLELENSGGATNNKVLLARTNSTETPIELLKEFLSTENESNQEFYQGQEIIYIPEEEFPAHIFEGKFQGFIQTFVSSQNDILIFANTQQAMKSILDDIRLENTWGKSSRSPQESQFLNPTSGFDKLFLVDLIWDSWVADTNPSWSSFLQKYSNSFRSFGAINFRINQIQGNQIGTLTFHYSSEAKPTIQSNEAISLSPSNRISFSNSLNYGPKVIINYQDKTEDILVQDDQNILHVINAAGKEVYSKQLSGPIISDAFQIDYYKNGKLQLLVATSDYLYGIDRLGNPLPNYPIKISGKQIHNLNLVDYSNSKDYRYFISTTNGDLYLLDKTGIQLEGWNPLSVKSKTIGPPAFYRVPSKGDFMVSLSEKGQFHLFNRRGELQTKSPIQLADSFDSKLVAWNDPSSKTVLLVGISSDGEVIHTNFNGEVTYRNQLVKGDRDHEFLIIPSSDESDFIFISRQFNEVQVLDRNEQLIFNVRASAEGLAYQYFDFGASRQLVAITDLTQGFTYLYDLAGKLLTTMPLESVGPIQISYQPGNGQYLIRTISGKTLTEFQLAD
ncbi:hypothetical protein [Algoriphagus marinus]|uniref:hypothetical protein n=1 Tax=Algoriphagus marinus TaxID=1925762 RepID=UPI00094B8BA5|nr:hypothetical protein [Algoriphagus marinus]